MRLGILYVMMALVAAASALDGCSLVSSPGTYTLTTDLFGANISVATPYAGSPQFACIAITSSNVVLDCDGFSINGNGTNNTFGVVIQKTDNSSISNVTVKDCGISDYPAADLFAYNLSGGNLSANELEEGSGIVLHSSSSNTVSNNDAVNDTGFLLISSTDNVLKGNSVTDGFGFMLLKNSDRNALNGSVVLGNSSGIQLNDSGNATIANTFMNFTGMNGSGIVLSNSSYDKVTNSTLTGDEFWGVLFFGDRVSHNVFSKTNMTADVPLVFGVNNTDSAEVNHFTDNVIGNTTINAASGTMGLIIFSNDTRNNVIADNSLTGDSVEFLAAISNGDFINNTLRNNNVTANGMEAFEFGALNNTINNTVLNTRINTNVTFVVAGIAFNDFANNKVDKTFVNTSALVDGIAMIALSGNFTNNSITNTNVTAEIVGLAPIPFPFIGAGENLDGNRFINTTFNVTNVSVDVLINSTNAMNNQFLNTNVNSQHFGGFGTGMGLSVNTSNDFTNNTFANTTIVTDDSDGIMFTTLHDFSGNRIQNTKLLNMSDASMISGLGFNTANDFNDNNITGTVISANATEGLLIEAQNNSARNILNNTYLPIGFGLGGPALLFVTGLNFTNNTLANTNVSAIDDLGIIIAAGNATGNLITNTRYTASDIGEVLVFAAQNDSRNNTVRDTTWNANQTGAFVVVAGNDFIGNKVLNTRHNTNITEEIVIGGLNNTINNTVANTNITGNFIGEVMLGAPVFFGPTGGDVVNNLFTNTSVSSNLTEFLIFASGNDFVNNTVSNTRFFANMSEGVGVIAANHSVGNLMTNTSVTGNFVGEVLFEAESDAISNRIQNTNIDTNLTEGFLVGGGNMTNNTVTDTRMRTNLTEGMIVMAANDSVNNSVLNTNITGNLTMEGLIFETGNDFLGNRVQNTNLNSNITGGVFFETGNDFRGNNITATAITANLTEGMLFETGNNSAFNRLQDTTLLANQSEGILFETTNDFLNNTVANTKTSSMSGGFVLSEAGNNTAGNAISGTNVYANITEFGLALMSDGAADSNRITGTSVAANLTEEAFALIAPNLTNNRVDHTTLTANITSIGFLFEGNNVSNNFVNNTAIASNFSDEGLLIDGDPINSTNNTIMNVVNVGGFEAGILVFSSDSLIDPIKTSNGGVGLYVSGNNNRINQLTAFNNTVAGFYDQSQGGNASTISNSLLYNNSWEIIQGSSGGQFVVNNTMLGNGSRQLTISLNDSVDAGYMLNDTGSPGSVPPGVFNSTARFLKLNFTTETQIDNLTVLNAGTSMFTWNSTNATPFWVLTPNQASSGSTVWALSLVNITSDDIYSFGQLTLAAPSGGGPSGGGSSTLSLSISFDQGTGVVTITSGGSPVPGADVKVDGSSIGTTDSNGQITVPGCGDNITIDALKSGYTAASAPESLKSCSQPPACASDQNCSSTQSCVAGSCVQVSCPNGTVVDHRCVVPQNQTQCTAPSCCTGSAQCGDTQACVTPSGAPGSASSPGSCQQVTGQCGVAANHTFVPYGYQCGTEQGCPSCPSGQSCEEHRCVQNDISCPSSVVVGQSANCRLTQNNQACGPGDNCSATITTPDGKTLTLAPDSNGNVAVPGSLTGRVKVQLVKDGQVIKEAFIDVVPKSQPTGTSAPAAPTGPDMSWLWLILLLVIVIGAVVYWRSRGKKK